MARDYDKQLSRVVARRRDLTKGLTEALAMNLEPQSKRSNQKSVRYALLGMDSLDKSYTEKSYEESGRVIAHLDPNLEEAGTPVTFEYQGSVPLNIHIRHQSDVDVLALVKMVLVYNKSGPRAEYYSSTNLIPKDEVKSVRSQSEQILKRAFPSAVVDTSGRKSITISGGSLSRKIDIVPAHWYDDIKYQETMDRTFRKVCIWNKKSDEMIENMPFLHMERINEKENASSGGAKKIIRLLKTLRADAEPRIELSSYDIASLVWHFDSDSMVVNSEQDLTLVAIARDNLEDFASNKTVSEGLMSPDGTRRILDAPEKFLELGRLFIEVRELAENIANEINPQRVLLAKALSADNVGREVGRILREAYIPKF